MNERQTYDIINNWTRIHLCEIPPHISYIIVALTSMFISNQKTKQKFLSVSIILS